MIYLGALLSLRRGLILPTEERFAKIQLALIPLCHLTVKARDFLHLLGLMASCIELVPNARLYMRPIQLHLLCFWTPAKDPLEKLVPCTPHLRPHLNWWRQRANIFKGCSVQKTMTEATITTDASKLMYGDHLDNQFVQGRWNIQQQNWHINLLEMEAIFLTMTHFLPQINQKSVLIKLENMTCVQYINRQGGTRSSKLCMKTWKIWNLAIQNQMILKAVHICGRDNVLADQLSRQKVLATEWSLKKEKVQNIFVIWGHPLMDLFASERNHQTEVFCTWFPSHRAFATDALSITWENMFAYAYPPICLIPKVLKHMSQFQCEIILIAPRWPRKHWYSELLQFLIASPIQLPQIPDLLAQPFSKICHPNPQIFQLVAWRLSTDC